LVFRDPQRGQSQSIMAGLLKSDGDDVACLHDYLQPPR
jgi:hypothetical protein